MSITKLEYRVWCEAYDRGAVRPMKNEMTIADYRFRLNANNLDMDPTKITTQIQWTGDTECLFTIEAEAPAEALSSAWETAAARRGLRTEPLGS